MALKKPTRSSSDSHPFVACLTPASQTRRLVQPWQDVSTKEKPCDWDLLAKGRVSCLRSRRFCYTFDSLSLLVRYLLIITGQGYIDREGRDQYYHGPSASCSTMASHVSTGHIPTKPGPCSCPATSQPGETGGESEASLTQMPPTRLS